VRKRLLILVLAGLICLTGTGCHFFWRRYHSTTHKFSITVPRWWELKENEPKGTAISVGSRQRGKKDRFRENLNVMVTELPDDESVEMFFDANRDALLKIMPGYKTDIEESEVFAGRFKGRAISFNADDGTFKLRFKTVVWIVGRIVYVVTATGEVDKYPRYEPVFNKMMRSIRFK
jgi:hypothetical protein